MTEVYNRLLQLFYLLGLTQNHEFSLFFSIIFPRLDCATSLFRTVKGYDRTSAIPLTHEVTLSYFQGAIWRSSLELCYISDVI